MSARGGRRGPKAMATGVALLALAAAGPGGVVPAAWAQSPGLQAFPEADLALGAKLIAQHRCSACHAARVGGDGSAIYRPTGRVGTPSALLSMVERCSTELNLGLFPEDVASVAAVLNRDHYRFGPSAPKR